MTMGFNISVSRILGHINSNPFFMLLLRVRVDSYILYPQTHLENISDKDGELSRVESRELLSALVSRSTVVWIHGEKGEAHQARVLGHCGCPDL